MVSDPHAADRDALAELGRRRLAARKHHHRQTQKPRRMDRVLADVLARFGNAVDQHRTLPAVKTELANWIATRVHCPGLHRAEAEKAAGYVLDPWPGEPALPVEVIEQLLNQLDEAEAKGQLRGARGRWFVGVLKRRLECYGITQRKKGTKRQ